MTQTSDRPMATGVPVAVPAAPDLAVGALDPTLEAELVELGVALAGHPFPTHQDDLLAALVAARLPARLACRLARLSRTRTYGSFDEVAADLRAGTAGD